MKADHALVSQRVSRGKMQTEFQEDTPSAVELGGGEPALIVDVGGFEGPLDLLLELARRQKVDLAKISILQLAEQYLEFVNAARKFRIELAADYLVMAAWLAYLKSRLLIPAQPAEAGPTAEDMAGQLARRLQKLEGFRKMAQLLEARNAAFAGAMARGAPEPVAVTVRPQWQANIYDLLSAYAQRRQVRANSNVTISRRSIWSLTEARDMLQRLAGQISDWTDIDALLLEHVIEPERRRSVTASTFAATLELVREGAMDLRQDRMFGPLLIRKRSALAQMQG